MSGPNAGRGHNRSARQSLMYRERFASRRQSIGGAMVLSASMLFDFLLKRGTPVLRLRDWVGGSSMLRLLLLGDSFVRLLL